jgi:hypothetical protein
MQMESTCEGWPGSLTVQMQASAPARQYRCRPKRQLASTDWLSWQLESILETQVVQLDSTDAGWPASVQTQD